MSFNRDTYKLGELARNASRPFNFDAFDDVIFINTGDVLEGSFLHCNISSKKGLPGQAKKAIKKNDILLSEIRPANKRFVYVDKHLDNYVVSTKFMVIEAIGKAIPEYLYILLTSNRTLAAFQLIAETRSGTFPQITFDSISHCEFFVPTIEVQAAVVDIIGALDKKIDLLKQSNQTLEAIAQTIFKSWFVNFDPVHAKKRGEACIGIDAETAALFPDSFEDSELGQIPKGWRYSILGEYITKLSTGRRPKGGIGSVVQGVPSIGAESITRIGEFDFSKTKFITQEFYDALKNGKVQSNDVLLYKDGGQPGVFLPRVSMFGDEFPFREYAINEHVFQIRISKPFSQSYLYFYLWSDLAMHELRNRGGKAAIPGINQQDVKELPLLIPSHETLSRFDQICTPIIATIFNNSKKMRTLSELRDTLLPRLISGKLDVSAIEAQIKEIA